jgi:hypothetical protein
MTPTKFAGSSLTLLQETLDNWDNDDYDFNACKKTIISTLNLDVSSPDNCSLRAYKDFFEFWVKDTPLTSYLIKVTDGYTMKRVKKGIEELFCSARAMEFDDFVIFNKMSDNTKSMIEIK